MCLVRVHVLYYRMLYTANRVLPHRWYGQYCRLANLQSPPRYSYFFPTVELLMDENYNSPTDIWLTNFASDILISLFPRLRQGAMSETSRRGNYMCSSMLRKFVDDEKVRVVCSTSPKNAQSEKLYIRSPLRPKLLIFWSILSVQHRKGQETFDTKQR